MLNLDDYSLGLILAHPDYYKNKKRERLFQGVSYDPFIEIPKEIAITMGVITLLRKANDKYYDEENSIWENELSYTLGQTNHLGITLAYVKPFKESYQEKATVYQEEELENDIDKKLDAIFNHSYYITHSKLTRKDKIITITEYPKDAVRNEYLQQLLGKKDYENLHQKTLKKE